MRGARGIVASLCVLCAIAPAAGADTAQAAISWTTCGTSSEFACGHLAVPLDPSGTVAGTITLAIRRHRAPLGEAHSAIVALAGGPGQAALPLASEFIEVLGPAAATRDVIVFDQRGTGLSHRLTCRLARLRAHGVAYPPGAAVRRCAESIGTSRAFYTTPDSVADLEAIREAAGYEKLVLYGTSYGTKVAEQYAAAYPQHVEALVLDSVVAPNGPDAFVRPSFAALPRILRALCAHGECAGITRDPVFDLKRLVQRMRRGALTGRAIDGYGHPHVHRIEADELLAMLFEGDFDPLLRAEFVSAVRAAVLGDDAALARLLAHSEHGEEFTSAPEALYLATICEEEPIPWNRQGSAAARLAEATARARALPAATFSPFTATTAIDLSDVRACDDWPFATTSPPVERAPLPNVPTLILSGAADLRTPTETAREVAAEIPDAHLVVVPLAGHSVLGSNFGECANEALRAMFSNAPIRPCPPRRPPPFLHVPPLPPRSIAQVSPVRGYHGLAGRTLHAVLLTVADAVHQLTTALLERLGGESFGAGLSLRGGGLRAGFFELGPQRLAFRGYSYVPGVRISGTERSGRLALTVNGSAAAEGTLKSGPHGSLEGELGGEDIDLSGRGQVTLARAGERTRPASLLARAEGEALALVGPALAPLVAN